MPGPIVATYKLPDFARAPNVKMGRDLQAFHLFEVRVRQPVQFVGKQCLHFTAAVNAWRQADGMQDDQVNVCRLWPWTKVGRCELVRKTVPAFLPKLAISLADLIHRWRHPVGHRF